MISRRDVLLDSSEQPLHYHAQIDSVASEVLCLSAGSVLRRWSQGIANSSARATQFV